MLPGGGQKYGENLHLALKRECTEEVNADIEIGNLIFIRKYMGENHEHYEFDLHVILVLLLDLKSLKEEKRKK
ncbi:MULTISPECIES: NUDIX domain-containing protein [Virgibacillus]|uniref:NUDIX domain-containing protein n=1 Tax=Virgibacillus TaxID=84406 RepID=UPI0017D55FF6|nr:NUDIX domain-containing protein [Virgibacillus sp.]NWO14186.1 NUDIX domain-containing protein [Virgibacillus sp.]